MRSERLKGSGRRLAHHCKPGAIVSPVHRGHRRVFRGQLRPRIWYDPFVGSHALLRSLLRCHRTPHSQLAPGAARDDQAILAAQRYLAREEGIFCEPASAVSVAGLQSAIEEGRIREGVSIVCTLTGHGLKDPDTAIAQSPDPVRVAPTVTAVRDAILN